MCDVPITEAAPLTRKNRVKLVEEKRGSCSYLGPMSESNPGLAELSTSPSQKGRPENSHGRFKRRHLRQGTPPSHLSFCRRQPLHLRRALGNSKIATCFCRAGIAHVVGVNIRSNGPFPFPMRRSTAARRELLGVHHEPLDDLLSQG